MPRPINPQALKEWLSWTDDQRYEFEERAAIIEADMDWAAKVTRRVISEQQALEQITKGK